MYSRKVILTILVGLVICTIIGLLFTKPDSRELVKQMFAYKVHSPQKYDLVVAGDSRIYRGVSTDIVGQDLNMHAINLGFSSGGFGKKMYELIDKKLSHKTNAIIILGITPFSFSLQALENGHIKRVKELKREEVLNYLYFSKITNYFTPANPLQFLPNNKPPYNYLQEVNIKEGWIKSDYIVQYPYSALKSYQNTFSNTQISNKAIIGLYEKIKEWNSNGIDVYGFVPPSSANMEELERNYSGFNDLSFAKGFLDAGGKWIPFKNIYQSYDGSHLNAESAIALSHELASAIKTGSFLSDMNNETNIRTSYFPAENKIEFFNNFENDSANTIKTELAHSGENVLLCKGSQKYIGLFNDKTEFLLHKNIKNALVDFYVYYDSPETKAKIVFEIKAEGKNPIVKALELSYSVMPQKWGNIKLDFEFPHDLNGKEQLKIYIRNTNNTSILVDDFSLYLY